MDRIYEMAQAQRQISTASDFGGGEAAYQLATAAGVGGGGGYQLATANDVGGERANYQTTDDDGRGRPSYQSVTWL
jgi:hypothetical protein